ncbi:c-type cytochrome biogenesis protein CcsB [soil metagenome]
MSTQEWETLANQAIGAAGVMYFLALLAHLVEWSFAVSRRSTESEQVTVAVGSVPAPASPITADREAEERREQRVAMFARLGFVLTVFALLCHAGSMVARGLAADRVPWGNMYEFTVAGVFFLVATYVVAYQRLKLNWIAPFVLGTAIVLLTLGVVALYAPVAPLTEALNSYWLVIHVISAIIATGAFILGGLMSVLYLLKDRFSWRWLERVPSLAVLDRVSYRVHAFAFPVWTFAVLITGPIWAHEAWGTYWNWDPKEVSAFVTWVIYAAYLHARATAGWKGSKAAMIAVVGVASALFNLIGVNYFSSASQHSYASAPALSSQNVGPAATAGPGDPRG